MDDKDKTKDNVKARQDVKEYCRRHELELVMEADECLNTHHFCYIYTTKTSENIQICFKIHEIS